MSISIADLNGTITNNIGNINLSSNQIWNLVDAKQDKLNASTIILRNGANITNINYITNIIIFFSKIILN